MRVAQVLQAADKTVAADATKASLGRCAGIARMEEQFPGAKSLRRGQQAPA